MYSMTTRNVTEYEKGEKGSLSLSLSPRRGVVEVYAGNTSMRCLFNTLYPHKICSYWRSTKIHEIKSMKKSARIILRCKYCKAIHIFGVDFFLQFLWPLHAKFCIVCTSDKKYSIQYQQYPPAPFV